MDLNKVLDAVDERLVFEAGRHRYKLDGEYVPGVTTILGSKNKPALEAWKVRVQQEADIETAWQAMQEWANFDSHAEFVSKFREAAGKEYEHQKQAREAADIGSQVHALAEKHMKDILGIPFEILQPPSEQAQAIFEKSWLPWEKDAGVVPLAVERRVYHAEHKYAGTVDLLATVEGRLTCLDWKSKGVAQVEKLYAEPVLQSVAYREALLSLTGETWGGLVINMPREGSGSVVAHPITGNDSWTLDDAFTVFLACKVLYVFDSKFNRKAKK
jgi:hypothetical protein